MQGLSKIFRAPIIKIIRYRAHRAVIFAIAWHLVIIILDRKRRWCFFSLCVNKHNDHTRLKRLGGTCCFIARCVRSPTCVDSDRASAAQAPAVHGDSSRVMLRRVALMIGVWWYGTGIVCGRVRLKVKRNDMVFFSPHPLLRSHCFSMLFFHFPSFSHTASDIIELNDDDDDNS